MENCNSNYFSKRPNQKEGKSAQKKTNDEAEEESSSSDIISVAEPSGAGPVSPVQFYQKAWEVATGLITHYNLHADPYEMIDLAGLLSCFDLRFMNLPSSTQGFTLDTEDKIIIALNDQLDHKETRFVAAHEIAHVALFHPSELNSCIRGQWFYNELEKEASAVAAFLLVPAQAVAKGLHDPRTGQSLIPKLERIYGVPGGLLLLRRALYTQIGY